MKKSCNFNVWGFGCLKFLKCSTWNILFFLIVLYVNLFSYNGNDFDKINIASSNISIGGCGVASFATPFSIMYNPALYKEKNSLSFGYGNYFDNSYWGNGLAYSVYRGSEFVSIVYNLFVIDHIPDTRNMVVWSGDSLLEYDSLDYNRIKFFSNSIHRLYLNYGRVYNNLSYGVNLKFYYRDLYVVNGFGVGADLGMSYKYRQLSFGVSFVNIIPVFMFWDSSKSEILYPELRIGMKFAYHVNDNVILNYYLDLIDFFSKESKSSMFSFLYNNFSITSGISVNIFNFLSLSFGFNGLVCDRYSTIKDYFYEVFAYGVSFNYKKVKIYFSANNNKFLSSSYNIEVNYIF